MVGRLVEQKDVGRRRQHARERGAARLTARQLRRIFRAGKAELLQEIAREYGVVARPEPGLDIGKRRGKAGEIRLLRQIAHDRPRLHEDRAAVGLDQSGGDFQQRRLA